MEDKQSTSVTYVARLMVDMTKVASEMRLLAYIA